MRMETILSRFEGEPLSLQGLSGYETWALRHFHDTLQVADPQLEMTLQLDINAALAAFDSSYAQAPGASLTAYLYWRLLQALELHPCFTWRRLEGRWYAFRNLPLYFPVAVGGRERFNDVLLENPFRLDWPVFCRRYSKTVASVLQLRIPFDPIGSAVWDLAVFIGNLPHLQFTAFSMHRQAMPTGRPIFYFGRRYQAAGSLHLPLYVQFDHANTDPYVLNLFLADYQRLLAGP